MVGIKAKAAAVAAGIGIVLLLITGFACYHIGKAQARVEIVEKEVEKIVEREKRTIEYVEKRVPVIEYITKENVKYIYNIEEMERRINEEIEKRTSDVVCDLTTDEHRLYLLLTSEANSARYLPNKPAD